MLVRWTLWTGRCARTTRCCLFWRNLRLGARWSEDMIRRLATGSNCLCFWRKLPRSIRIKLGTESYGGLRTITIIRRNSKGRPPHQINHMISLPAGLKKVSLPVLMALHCAMWKMPARYTRLGRITTYMGCWQEQRRG